NISNKGGLADNTIIDVSRFYMFLGDNQFNANFRIKTPVSDPEIKAKITGNLDLDNINEYYPIDDGDKLKGEIILDMLLEGRLSSIENEKYEDFLAMGSLVVKDINYSSSSLKDQVHIPNAQLNFSPHYLDLVNFKAKTGNNDLQLTGKLENYLGYYFNDGTLSGNLISNSNYLNIDELFVESFEETNLPETTVPVENSQTVSKSGSVIEIPDNINITVTSRFKKLIYDSLEMENVKGKLSLANKTLQINNLRMKAVEGNMTLNGSYSSIDVNKPEVDLSLKMENLSIPDAYNKFAIFRTYLPLAKKSTGLFSADFNVNTVLDEKMMPDYSTLNGGGVLSTSKITI
ncbi:MAG: hypothetical protein KAH32_08600, partial [Chlamydiia bacterium]|nr:hypothetical protein [Chlamydiia bacterium]